MKQTLIWETFKASFKLIIKDYIIFTPYLFLFLGLNLANQVWHFQNNLEFLTLKNFSLLSLIWLISLIFEGYILAMAKSLEENQHISIFASFKYLMKKVFSLLINGLPLYLIMVLCLKYIYIFSNSTSFNIKQILFFLILLIIIFLVSFINQFLPIIIIAEQNKKWWQVFLITVNFCKTHFLKILLFLLFVVLIALIMFLASSILEAIPWMGKTILTAILQALTNTFITVFTYKFYLRINNKINVVIH